jgi:hypothetical protein
MARANAQHGITRISIGHRKSASALLARRGVHVALSRYRSEGGDAMSRVNVGLVIEKLLTDENLRIRFALDRLETVAELCLRGFDLTRDEIDLLCRTDAGVWFLRSAVSGTPQH